MLSGNRTSRHHLPANARRVKPDKLTARPFREPLSRPATQMREQPRREPHRGLTLFGLQAADCAAIKHALGQVDVAAASNGKIRSMTGRMIPDSMSDVLLLNCSPFALMNRNE